MGSPLRDLENAVPTPHAGRVSPEACGRLVRAPADDILAFLAGRPQNVVNPEVLGRIKAEGRRMKLLESQALHPSSFSLPFRRG